MRLDRVMRRALAPAMAACALAAQAQLVAPSPDWKEAEVPPPPALKTGGLIPVDMGSSVLRWGVDPASISIGSDGIVRYVVVAQGDGGSVNALYEGLRCNTAEVKLYARYAGDRWTPVREAEWKPMHGSSATRHSLFIARNGACVGSGANRSPTHIARDLGRPLDFKFLEVR